MTGPVPDGLREDPDLAMANPALIVMWGWDGVALVRPIAQLSTGRVLSAGQIAVALRELADVVEANPDGVTAVVHEPSAAERAMGEQP